MEPRVLRRVFVGALATGSLVATAGGATGGWPELMALGPLAMATGAGLGALLKYLPSFKTPPERRGRVWRWLSHKGRGASLVGFALAWTAMALLPYRGVVLFGFCAAGSMIVMLLVASWPARP